mgnify:CR=1 FL=1
MKPKTLSKFNTKNKTCPSRLMMMINQDLTLRKKKRRKNVRLRKKENEKKNRRKNVRLRKREKEKRRKKKNEKKRKRNNEN